MCIGKEEWRGSRELNGDVVCVCTRDGESFVMEVTIGRAVISALFTVYMYSERSFLLYFVLIKTL